MEKIFKGFILFVFSVCLSEGASGQIKGISIGDTVKVTAQSISDNEVIGIVTEISSEIISISEGYSQYYLYEIPIEAIEKLEMQKEVRNTGKGALIGAGVGGLILGTISLASNESCNPDEWCFIEFSDGEAFLMGTAAGLLPGAIIGAVVGSTIKTKKWKKIPFEITIESITLNYLDHSPSSGVTLKWSF